MVPALSDVTNLTEVAQLTGEDSLNETDQWGVHGTDLGSMVEMDGRIYMFFGDTFGLRSPSHTGAGGQNWRSNALAYTTDMDPSDGIEFDGMVVDERDRAKELLAARKVDGDEITIIPTGGYNIDDRLYMNFMSVRQWGTHGDWTANYAGVARSDDEGRTWEIIEGLRWPGESPFIQVTSAAIDDYIYFWTIPAGRFGGVRLMRVAETEAEDLDAYEYFAGSGLFGQARWSGNMERAEEIVDPSVGELSVIWNEYLDRWIMTYLNEDGAGIEIRESPDPWGPWSDPTTLVPRSSYPGLYGAYMHPRYLEDEGRVIYFAMSLWEPYNVFWMSAELSKE